MAWHWAWGCEVRDWGRVGEPEGAGCVEDCRVVRFGGLEEEGRSLRVEKARKRKEIV